MMGCATRMVNWFSHDDDSVFSFWFPFLLDTSRQRESLFQIGFASRCGWLLWLEIMEGHWTGTDSSPHSDVICMMISHASCFAISKMDLVVNRMQLGLKRRIADVVLGLEKASLSFCRLGPRRGANSGFALPQYRCSFRVKTGLMRLERLCLTCATPSPRDIDGCLNSQQEVVLVHIINWKYKHASLSS